MWSGKTTDCTRVLRLFPRRDRSAVDEGATFFAEMLLRRSISDGKLGILLAKLKEMRLCICCAFK